MGQRHQIYVKSNYDYTQKKTLNVFHIQWLYGKMAIIQLYQTIKYNQEANKYFNLSVGRQHTLESTSYLIESLYSVNPEIGYYNKIINLRKYNEYYLHPHSQDNNDGQTFIDFTSSVKPKICFSFPFHLEDKNIKADTPLTPLEYLSLYYETDLSKIEDKSELSSMRDMLKIINYIEKNTNILSKEELDDFYLTIA